MKEAIQRRATQLYAEQLAHSQEEASRVFFWLFITQWIAAIILALILSPYAWSGSSRSVHIHAQLAVFGGFVLNALPLLLLRSRPSWFVTRPGVAAAQMLWSAMFVHLTGGR